MDNYILHKADTRGEADHGWLKSFHTFSFASYYNPERVHFGALRVLNDDTVAPGMGFGTHPHQNMEIISIPLEGDLEHKDSMGNTTVIKNGEIQIMSAGTGVQHSEYNKNKDREVKFLQIWVFPKTQNTIPTYDQISLDTMAMKNNLLQIVSPEKSDRTLKINNDVWFHIGNFDQETTIEYQLKKKENGVYIFILNGNFFIEDIELSKRDGIGIWSKSNIKLKSTAKESSVLIMEVPM